MRIDVITLFPEMFVPFLNSALLRIAREKGLVEVVLVNLRDFATDRRGTVDDRPFGGGPGMVLKPEPVVRAVESLTGPVEAKASPEGATSAERPKAPEDREAEPKRPGAQETSGTELVLLTPQGEPFSQRLARTLAEKPRLTLLAGHYEGFDERVRLILTPREISIGDYVLSGGELPAMVVMEAVVRLIPGVLGDELSAVEESFEPALGGLLDYPQYTRPREFRGLLVPEVLVSGDHEEVARWRRAAARRRTAERRSDLLPGEPA
jgi:tRNA (guanine37-N1)-methyltransferase